MTPSISTPPKRPPSMNRGIGKEVFLLRFVLTRAGNAHNGTDGEAWAREAVYAWNYIKKELKDHPE